jgi:glucosylceramidase
MSQERRDEVLCAYFDPEKGLGFNMGRVPIGSCDLGLSSWTCGDLKDGDMELQGFSLDHYREAILPMLVRAAKFAGAPLNLLASPWSPPPWMKSSGRFDGEGRGHLRPECRAAWALHYVRFVQQMAQAGVPIWGVSVQNEPGAAQAWESCLYSAEEERDFVRDHLGPAFEETGLLENVRIVIHDHNRDTMLERAAVVYDDPEAARFVWGTGYHWYGDARFEAWPHRSWVPFEDRQCGQTPIFELRAQVGFDNVRRVAELRPDKHLLSTEGCQKEPGHAGLLSEEVASSWKQGERHAMNFIADVNSGCEGWIDWTFCVDETGGPSHAGNTCLAPVICDTQADQLLFRPSFWYLGHFARHIRPGARRVVCGSSRDVLEVTAFKNPDTSVIVVVLNQSEEGVDFVLKVAGAGAVCTEAPARSITTFVVLQGPYHGTRAEYF